jgi:AraC family transcriptional activator FtrA
VRSTAGFSVLAEHGLEALAAADTVVVPGYLPLDDPGERVCSALRQAGARGARMVSVCTGAFALAAAGLLDHRRATTHWEYAGQLAARHPAVKVDPDVLWVDEGAVLTSAGLAAGIDLCVQLVRADHGSQAAVAVARRMVVAPHRDGGQAQWLERPVPPLGEDLAGTCQWALEHLADRLTVADLARHAGWAPRPTCDCTWPATPTPPPPLTGPRTRAARQTSVRQDPDHMRQSRRWRPPRPRLSMESMHGRRMTPAGRRRVPRVRPPRPRKAEPCRTSLRSWTATGPSPAIPARARACPGSRSSRT